MDPILVTRAPGKLAHNVQIRTHRLLADVDASSGGEDRGPSPHDLLAASLGTCTAITLQMYCDRKGWPLTQAGVEVFIVHEGGMTIFHRKLKLAGELNDSQRKRLLEIAEMCPIHKALQGTIHIQTALI